MTPAELLAAIEGVPDEALPPHFRGIMEPGGEMPDGNWAEHAAVGSMVAWLVTHDRFRATEIFSPTTADPFWEVSEIEGPTLLHALAAACRAVNTGETHGR